MKQRTGFKFGERVASTMSVHVFLQPAVMAPTVSAKATLTTHAGPSFTDALAYAAEAPSTQVLSNTSGRDSDKRQQKKTEPSDDAASMSTSAPGSVDPSTILLLPPVMPTMPLQADQPEQTAVIPQPDQPVDSIAPHSLSSDEATVGGNLLASAGAAAPALPAVTEGPKEQGELTEAKAEITSAKPAAEKDTKAEQASKPVQAEGTGAAIETSGVGRILSEAQAPSPNFPELAGATGTDSVEKQTGSLVAASTDIPVGVAPDTSNGVVSQVASAVDQTPSSVMASLQTMIAAPQASSADQPSGVSASMTSATGKAGSPASDRDGSSGKVGPVRTQGTSAKDHATAGERPKTKSSATDDDTQSEATATVLACKPVETPTAPAHHQSSGQAGDQDLQALQAGSVVSQPGTQQPVSVHGGVAPQPTGDFAARNLPLSESGSDAVTASGISGARLIQSVHQSEMKLGMNSAEFGNISISTSVTHQVLSAQISLDHAELGRALAAHLPAMEQRLGDAYGLRARVEVRDGGNGASQGSPQHSEERPQGRQDGSAKPTMFSSALPQRTGRITVIPTAEASRLDIRI